jgi:hypothetical protein
MNYVPGEYYYLVEGWVEQTDTKLRKEIKFTKKHFVKLKLKQLGRKLCLM